MFQDMKNSYLTPFLQENAVIALKHRNAYKIKHTFRIKRMQL
jgi:hypothetical protein